MILARGEGGRKRHGLIEGIKVNRRVPLGEPRKSRSKQIKRNTNTSYRTLEIRCMEMTHQGGLEGFGNSS